MGLLPAKPHGPRAPLLGPGSTLGSPSTSGSTEACSVLLPGPDAVALGAWLLTSPVSALGAGVLAENVLEIVVLDFVATALCRVRLAEQRAVLLVLTEVRDLTRNVVAESPTYSRWRRWTSCRTGRTRPADRCRSAVSACTRRPSSVSQVRLDRRQVGLERRVLVLDVVVRAGRRTGERERRRDAGRCCRRATPAGTRRRRTRCW